MQLNTVRRATCLLTFCFTLPLAFAGGDVVPAASVKAPAVSAPATAKPLWSELNATQKAALAPLSAEWDRMDEIRKKKWLGIINRYTAMKPDEQARVQERMRDWVKLTPEQRMAARENFAKTTKVKPEQKSVQWQQYQQLSDEEKKRLASEASQKKTVTNLQSEALKNPKILAPIKVRPKPAAAPAANPVAPPAATAIAPANPSTPTASATPAVAAPATPPTPATNATPASQAIGK